MKKIILASGSPRRKELLEKNHIHFIIDYQDTEEVLDESLTLCQQLENIALQKTLPISLKYPSDIVIGADTMVCLNDKMLGKPVDRNDAKNMLIRQSGNKQIVYTAVCIIDCGKQIVFTDSTEVYFKELSDKEIELYLDTNEWQGKAGGYAIQGLASKFVNSINGDKDTVIGLPTKLVLDYLKRNNK